MDENKVTGEHASEERHHHHHHHHHSGRKKRSRRHGFYTVSNSILLVWIVVLTIALMVLVAKLMDMNDIINRLAEFHDLEVKEQIIELEPPISVDEIV